jgi:hypothetical protein
VCREPSWLGRRLLGLVDWLKAVPSNVGWPPTRLPNEKSRSTDIIVGYLKLERLRSEREKVQVILSTKKEEPPYEPTTLAVLHSDDHRAPLRVEHVRTILEVLETGAV